MAWMLLFYYSHARNPASLARLELPFGLSPSLGRSGREEGTVNHKQRNESSVLRIKRHRVSPRSN